jgi:hypothetical protein
MSAGQQYARTRAAVDAFNTSAKAQADKLRIALPNNFFEIANAQLQKSGSSLNYSIVSGAVVGVYNFNGAAAVDAYAKNPQQFLKNAVQNAGYDYAWASDGAGANDASNVSHQQNLQVITKAAADSGIPVSDIKSLTNTGAQQYGNWKGSDSGGFLTNLFTDLSKTISSVGKEITKSPIAQVALAYYMPTIASSFASSLSAFGITTPALQTAAANAISNAALQIAQGVPLDKALQTAATNYAVSTGSSAALTQFNKVITNPAVSEAIVSAGSSAAKTALNGGSQSDIERNLVGGLLGSATASATGSKVAGSAVGGGVTGGVTGALTGAASAYGEQKLAEEKAAKEKAAAETKPPTTAGNFVSGINLAAADTGTVSDAGGFSVGVSGTPIFADSPRAASVKAPSGFAVMPIEMADNKPSGAYYDITQNAWIAPITDIEKFTTPSEIKSADASRVPVAPGIDLTQPTTTPSVYDPTIITLGVITPPTSSKAGTTTTSTSGTAGGTSGKGATTGGGTVTGTGTSGAGTGAGTGAGLRTGSGGTGAGTGASTGISAGTGTGAGGAGTTPKQPMTGELATVKVTASGEPEIVDSSSVDTTPKELPPVEEKKLPPVEDKIGTPVSYDPNLFIYGGVKPKSSLGSSLKTQAPFYPLAGTSGGLTSTRGAGELESKETGKKRQNVWNEESLRLKDALGI